MGRKTHHLMGFHFPSSPRSNRRKGRYSISVHRKVAPQVKPPSKRRQSWRVAPKIVSSRIALKCSLFPSSTCLGSAFVSPPVVDTSIAGRLTAAVISLLPSKQSKISIFSGSNCSPALWASWTIHTSGTWLSGTSLGFISQPPPISPWPPGNQISWISWSSSSPSEDKSSSQLTEVPSPTSMTWPSLS
jgi:hypothetical protein